jgi:signal transduction histidine kinase/PAS domain-containing protein/putative methionine-R-sulfoxide reductase with GAF domain
MEEGRTETEVSSEEIARAIEGQHPTSESLNHLAFLILHEAPTTFCRILLITTPGRLCIKAAQPLRQTQWTPLIDSEYLQNPESPYWKAITERRVVILLRDQSNELTFDQFAADFGAQLSALAIFPLLGSQRVPGLLVLGEQRQAPRIPFDPEALSFYEQAAREIALELERQEAASNFSQLGYLVETILPRANLVLIGLNEMLHPWYISPGMERLLDLEPSQLIGNDSWLEYLHPTERRQIEATLKQFAREGGSPLELEFCLLGSSRHPRWVRGVFTRLKEPISLSGILLDISDQVKQRQALEASQSFLSSILDQSPLGMMVLDQMGTAIRLNGAINSFFSLASENEILGKYNIFRDEVLQKAGTTACLQAVYQAQETVSLDLEYDFELLRHVLLPGRPKKWLRLTCFPIQGHRTRPDFAVGLFQDITQEKEESAAREMRTQELAVLFQTAQALGRISGIANASRSLQEMLASIKELMKTDAVALAIYGEQGEILTLETNLPSRWQQSFPQGKRLAKLLFEPVEQAQGPVFLCKEGDFGKLSDFGVRAYIGYPLLRTGNLLGMLCLCSTQPQTWQEEEVRFLENLVQNLTIGLERLRLDQMMGNRLKDLEFIYQSSLELFLGLDMQVALDRTIDALYKLFGAQGVIIYQKEQEYLRPLLWRYNKDYTNLSDEELGKRLPMKVGQGLTGTVAMTGQELLVDDADRDPRGRHIEGTPVVDETFMAVPLKVKGEVRGVITAAKLGLAQFGERELNLLKTFAASVSVAMDNAQLFQKVETSNKQLKAVFRDLEAREKLLESLIRAFRRITQKIHIDELLKEILELAVAVIPGAESGSILVREGDEFHYRAAVGYDLTKLQQINLPVNTTLGRSLSEGRISLLKGSTLRQKNPEELTDELREQLEAYGRQKEIQCLLSVPIMVRGGLFGYINLENFHVEDAFSRNAQDALWLFAQQATIAVETALLFKEQEKLVIQLERDVQEISNLSQVKEDFLYTVSHELKTPLMVSLGTVELLNQGQDRQKMIEYHEILQRNLKRLLALIDNLLITSKGDTLSDVKFADADIVSLLEEELASARVLGHNKDLVFQTAFAPSRLELPFDAYYLRQAFSNILSNAVKFSSVGGKVEIRLKKEDHSVLIAVSDEGIGIPPEDLPHIFDRFYRSPHALQAAVAGTGLGLHTTKVIVESHRGEIWLESEKGKGTTVYVRLPMVGN